MSIYGGVDGLSVSELLALQAAAKGAGNFELVATCERALKGDYLAMAECLRAVGEEERDR